MSLPGTFRKLSVIDLVPDFRRATAIVEAPLALPGPGEILVRNRYMGVNGSDPVAVCGGYGITALPYDVGLDSAGEVVAIGTDVESVSVGDAVLIFAFGGGYSEYRLATEEQVYPISSLSADLLAAFIPAITASVGLTETRALRSGETVMVTAAAGGVGSYAVQLARLAGNHVIGTTGDSGKATWLHSLGCDRVVDYRSEDLDAVLAAEYPQGVDVVFETVGRQTFDVATRHLANFGRLLAMGATSEYADGVSWEVVEGVRIYQTLMAKSATLAAATLALYPRSTWIRHLDRVIGLVGDGKLQVARDPQRFVGLEAVADAVENMSAGRNRGKVIVDLP